MKQRFECICFHFVRTDSIMALRSRGMGTIRGLFPVGARDTPDNLTSCCFHAIIVNINENMGPSVCLVCAYLSFTQKVRVRFPYGLLLMLYFIFLAH